METLVLVKDHRGNLVYMPVWAAELSRVVVCNAVMKNGQVEKTGDYVPITIG